MASFPRSCLSFWTLFVIFPLFVLTIDGTERVYMNITNNLGEIPLFIRCQSKDDDIGSFVLNFHDSLKWDFKPNFFFETTLFFCSMRWNGVSGSFDVYRQRRDQFRCHERCWWSIQTDGAYFYDETTEMFYLMYKW